MAGTDDTDMAEMKKTELENLPEELQIPLKKTDFIIRSYLAGLHFLALNSARDPNFSSRHFLTYLFFDFLQSALAIQFLAYEGLINVAKRELRFLIEASVKLCFVHQENYNSSIEDKLTEFGKILDSHKISVKKNLDLSMLSEEGIIAFSTEVGKIYHDTSSYVHLTSRQINERIEAIQAEKVPGKEKPEDIDELNILLSRGLSCSLVLIMHSVPEYAAGDWLVEENGKSNPWYFSKSQFITQIDRHFDYKHERINILDQLENDRTNRTEF